MSWFEVTDRPTVTGLCSRNISMGGKSGRCTVKNARQSLWNENKFLVYDWPFWDTNKQEMVNWREGSCFRSRPMGDTGDSASGGAFSLAPSKPLCIIIITTLQLQLQGTGQQRAGAMPRGGFYFGNLSAAVRKCYNCSFTVSATDMAVLQWGGGHQTSWAG